MAKAKFKLYWCWTLDETEDWFVTAKTEKKAERFFADEEGFDHREACARQVGIVPDRLQGVVQLGYPLEEVIEACGGTFLHRQTPRVVRLENKVTNETFTEGFMEFMVSQGDLNAPKA